MTISVRVRRKSFATRGGDLHVLGPLEFTIHDNEIAALVGPSGAGKSTLLRLVGGLDTDFDGDVSFAGAATPRIGTVFQEPRLLPWRTVWQNLEIVLPPGLEREAEALLRTLGVAEFRDTYPTALSLGMARRVAIARAFAIAPELVLLDEPFVSLDPAMAERSREVLLTAWSTRPTAALLVTHDLAEAAALADRILLLSSRPARILADIAVPAHQKRQGIEVGAQVAAAIRAETLTPAATAA